MTHSCPWRSAYGLGDADGEITRRQAADAVLPLLARIAGEDHLQHRTVALPERIVGLAARAVLRRRADGKAGGVQDHVGRRKEIGRAHVCTPVTNAHLVCRLPLENTTTKA